MINLIKYKTAVQNRSDLMTLLSEACELEHGLACSYLYSAFSMKKDMDEGLSGFQLQYVRKWAAKIFFIASQEMLHLSQAWNLLNAIGGTPYYFRPNFPQPSKYYPLHVPLKLERFSLEALKRFILYELPSDIDEKSFAQESFGHFSEDNFNYRTVGQLYGLIKDGFCALPERELFIGNPQSQMGEEEVDFHEIIRVTDRESAVRAIEMITEQGEGTKNHRENSHYEGFKVIEAEYKGLLTSGNEFVPARNVLTNPISYLGGDYQSAEGEIIVNDLTREISTTFDDVYSLMLRCLQFAFAYSKDREIRLSVSKFSIFLMVRVIRPFGELLTKYPAYNDSYLKSAGPSFTLTRHIPFPGDPALTITLIKERGNEILQILADLLKKEPSLEVIYQNYADVLKSILSPEMAA